MEEIVRYTPDLHGKESELFPGDAEIVVLREDRAGTTLLGRLRAGGKINKHSHVGTVQHFVLSGEYESGGRVFEAGSYRLVPAMADVPAITSHGGAVVLIIYDAPAS